MILVHTHIKKFIYAVIVLLFYCTVASVAHAQDNPSDDKNKDAQQKLEALKMAYLTQQLDLSPKEAEKFWPLYNQYQKDMHNIIEKRKQVEMNKNQLNQADNKQIEQSMNQDFQLQQQALQVRQKYQKAFQNVLPPRKVMKVYRSEKDFNMKLIEELHRRQADPSQMIRQGNRPQRSSPTYRPTRQQTPQTRPPARKFSRPEQSPANRPTRSRPPRH